MLVDGALKASLADVLGCKLTSFAPCDTRPLPPLLAARPRAHEAGADLAPCAPALVARGWAAKVRVLHDGRRQVVCLLLPGDILRLEPHEHCTLAAVTPMSTVDARALLESLEGDEGAPADLQAAWEAARRHEAGLTIDQVVRLGCMTAYERTLHLLLELRDRLLRAGLAAPNAIPMPVSQDTLSNVLGVSVVHMNRTLQQLRRDNLIDYRARRLEFKDVAAAVELAGYRPGVAAKPGARTGAHVFR